MERRSIYGNLWRIVYPLLIYYLIAWLVCYGALLGIILLNSWNDIMALPADATMEQIDAVVDQYMTQEAIAGYQQTYLKYFQSIQLGIDCLVLPFLLLIYLLDRKKEVRGWHSGKVSFYWYIVPAVVGCAVCLFGNLLVNLFGMTQTADYISLITDSDSAAGNRLLQLQSSPVFRLIAAGMIAPLVEELLFRGILLKRIRAWRGVFSGIVWSSLIYAANYGTASNFFYALIIGICAAYLYEKFRNLWAPVLFHCFASISALFMERYIDRVNELLGSNFRMWVSLVFSLAVLAVAYIIIQYYINCGGDNKNETIDNNGTVV